MSDEKQETRADIIAEMRNLGKLDEKSTDKIPRSLMGLGLRTYAARLEAAWKREETQHGNMAAMREALVAVKKSIDDIGSSSLDCDPEILMMSLTQVCARLSARIEAALAAPPRNCDVGTAEERMCRYNRIRDEINERYERLGEIPPSFAFPTAFEWEDRPYEKGNAS